MIMMMMTTIMMMIAHICILKRALLSNRASHSLINFMSICLLRGCTTSILEIRDNCFASFSHHEINSINSTQQSSNLSNPPPSPAQARSFCLCKKALVALCGQIHKCQHVCGQIQKCQRQCEGGGRAAWVRVPGFRAWMDGCNHNHTSRFYCDSARREKKQIRMHQVWLSIRWCTDTLKRDCDRMKCRSLSPPPPPPSSRHTLLVVN
jgi:hypothetical protein